MNKLVSFPKSQFIAEDDMDVAPPNEPLLPMTKQSKEVYQDQYIGKPKSTKYLPRIQTVLAFLCGIVFVVLFFHASDYFSTTKLRLLEPAGRMKVQFQYNETFPGPPTVESELAWLELLPDGLGTVQNEDLSDAIVTISVFHQLHCLMEIRHAIYDQWNGTRHSHMAPHHSRHCLEYLRQSIMCNADTNIEYRVVREDGVKETPGWDTKRCRNYYQIRDWAQHWRAFDGKIPSQKAELYDEESLHGRIIVY